MVAVAMTTDLEVCSHACIAHAKVTFDRARKRRKDKKEKGL